MRSQDIPAEHRVSDMKRPPIQIRWGGVMMNNPLRHWQQPFLALVALAILLITSVPLIGQSLKNPRVTPEQLRALQNYPAEIDIELGSQAVPFVLAGRLSPRTKSDVANEAARALAENGAAYRKRYEDDFRPILRVAHDDRGQIHVRMQQTYRGLPVINGELVVHMDNSYIAGITGRFFPDIAIDTAPTLSLQRCSELAVASIAIKQGLDAAITSTGELSVYVARESDLSYLVYPVNILYRNNSQLISGEQFLVDAHAGTIVARFPGVTHARSRTVYDAGETSDYHNLPGTFLFGESGPTTGADSAERASYENAGIVYDFYQTVFGRDSWDGNGAELRSSVHFSYGVLGWLGPDTNAAWYGPQWVNPPLVVFGDGDLLHHPLSEALDVVAHEWTHAVTSTTAQLIYASDSGALNEASSDILGESAEFWHGGGDWTIGEDLPIWPLTDPLRWMNDPAKGTCNENKTSKPCPDYYPDRFYTGSCVPTNDNDDCGVHSNSGIGNLFFYLLSVGGTHPRNKTAVIVPAIGINRARDLWYRALTGYFVPDTTFAEARSLSIQAAKDATESAAVALAWDAVGVTASPSLGVTLQGNPSSGTSPLNTTLSAAVTGTATGTINYTFWWNCSDPGTSVSAVTAVCGDPTNSSIGAKFNAVTTNPQQVQHTYSPAGVYSAKVIAEQGLASPAEARKQITAIGPSKMISPAPQSTLSSSSVTFTWDSGTGVTRYWLYVGRSKGAADIYNHDQVNSLSATVGNLPTDGSTIYVTLWSWIGSGWLSNPYTYIACSACSGTGVISIMPASINFGSVPVSSSVDRAFTVQNTGNSTLSGIASVAAPFSVVSGGAYTLSPGQSQPVTVRFSPSATQPYSQTVTFNMVAGGGSGATAQVTGKGTSASATPVLPRLPICGDEDGSQPLILHCPELVLSADVQSYRALGSGIVQMRFKYVFRDGAIYNNEFGFFKADGPSGAIGNLKPGAPGYFAAAFQRATIVFPSGSTASSSDVTVTVPAGAVLVFFIVQNDTLANLLASNPSNQSGKLPLAFFSLDSLNPDGIRHFVGFQDPVSNFTQFGFEDETGGGDLNYDDIVIDVLPQLDPQTVGASMITPAPGSTLGSSATFTWGSGSAVSQYWLYVGRSPGGSEIYSQDQGTSPTALVTNLPTDGSAVYVRLWSLIGSRWQYEDYTYGTGAGFGLLGPVPGLALTWPVAGYDFASLGQDYAQFNWGKASYHHTGLDVEVPVGTRVNAAGAGVVRRLDMVSGQFQGDNHCMGNVVIIDHSFGTNSAGPFTLYAHLDQITVADQQTVSQGDAIATSGPNSAWVQRNGCTPPQPHLHFEVKDRGVLGDNTDDGPNWGYTPDHPDNHGYHDPVLNLHSSGAVAPTTVVVTAQGQGAALRIGPNVTYRCFVSNVTGNQCRQLNAGDTFVAWATAPATTGCSSGWYQITATANVYQEGYFPDLSRGSSTIPDAWVCRGNTGETWITPQGSGSASISVAPNSIDFSSVPVGSFVDRVFTVQNTGGGTLSGNASAIAPFSVVSGASYTLSAGQIQTVTVRFSPSGSQTYNQNVAFSGGSGASRAVTGTGIPVAAAMIISPAPGSTLGSSSTFGWDAGSGVSQYWLYVGRSVGGKDVYTQNQGTNRSVTVSSLPTDGTTVYVRLWSLIGSSWQFRDYTYKASGGPISGTIASPTPGSRFTSTSVIFTWSSGIGVSQYWLYVGRAVGHSEIYGQNQGTNLSATVNNLPIDGSTVYVRLWSLIGNSWFFNDYTYGAGGIIFGQTISGNLSSTTSNAHCNSGTPADRYFFSVSTPTAVSIGLSSSAFDTYLCLLDSSNKLIAADDDSGGNLNSSITLTLPAGGFFLEATSFSGTGTGAYTLSVQPATIVSPGAMTLGQTLTGNLSSTAPLSSCTNRPADRYAFTVSSPTTVTINLSSTAFDTFVCLLNSSNNYFAWDDNSGGGTNSRLIYTNLNTGSYFIEVSSYTSNASGAYTLSLQPGYPPGLPISLGQTLTGNLSSTAPLSSCTGHSADRYAFTLSTQSTVTIKLSSSVFDTYVCLLNSSNYEIGWDDNSGGGTNSRLVYSNLPAGSYFIEVSSYVSNAAGTYTLSLQPGYPPGLPISLGQTLTGNLSSTAPLSSCTGHSADRYAFTLSTQSTVTINLSSSVFDTYVCLLNSSNYEIGWDDNSGGGTNSRLVYSNLPAGSYFIEVSSYTSNATGAYALSLQ
jgi:Zn-dependent metalloprotease/murein DD-endopeptidase MepM/ murein hydrolase activator NlpD